MEGRRTISYYAKRLVDVYGDRQALISKKEYRTVRWTYRELFTTAHRIAGLLAARKIRKGDKILIYLYNSPEWGALFLACALSGIIAVPIDFNSNVEFPRQIATKTKAKVVFSSRFKRVRPRCDEIFIEDLYDHIQEHAAYRCNANIREDDILELVYTSGTTSDPKGVVITNKNLVSNIRSLHKLMPLPSEHRFLSILPLSHLLEQTLGFFLPLRFGCKIVYTQSRRSSILLEAMQEHRITAIVGVPILLKTLKENIERAAKTEGKERSLRRLIWLGERSPPLIKPILAKSVINHLGGGLEVFFVGGAPLDEGVERFWNALGVVVLQGYGLTETSPVLTCNTWSAWKPGTVGKALPDQQVKINDGEIVCKGDNVTQGYYNNRRATGESIIEGWFHTGDLGEFDEEGYLSIKGRKKNMILTDSGMNIYPEDIEMVLDRMQGVKDSCVLGIAEKGKIIVTGIVMPEKALDKKKILDKANTMLDSHQQLQRLIVWPEKDFPRTPSLKIKKREVLARLSKKEQKERATSDDVLERILLDISDAKQIKPTSILATDLAIDSLHRIELVTIIEEEFNVEIPEEAITAKTTVKDLRKMIAGASERQRSEDVTWLNTSKAVRPARWLCQEILFSICRLYYPLKVIGKSNIPKKGPVIFAMNHTSHLDTPTLLNALPMRYRTKTGFAAAADYFFEGRGPIHRIKVGILRLILNTFPFSRTGSIRKSLKATGHLLDRGISIAIFPEGTRTTTGKPGVFKNGIGLLLNSMEVPVVPVHVKGLYEMLPKGESRIKRGKAIVRFGKPLSHNVAESYIKATRRVQKAVFSLHDKQHK